MNTECIQSARLAIKLSFLNHLFENDEIFANFLCKYGK